MPPKNKNDDSLIAPADPPADSDAATAPPAGGATGPASHAEAAQARASAYAEANPDRARREIDALLEERRGYVQRGKTDRVDLVDEQIRLRGGTPPTED